MAEADEFRNFVDLMEQIQQDINAADEEEAELDREDRNLIRTLLRSLADDLRELRGEIYIQRLINEEKQRHRLLESLHSIRNQIGQLKEMKAMLLERHKQTFFSVLKLDTQITFQIDRLREQRARFEGYRASVDGLAAEAQKMRADVAALSDAQKDLVNGCNSLEERQDHMAQAISTDNAALQQKFDSISAMVDDLENSERSVADAQLKAQQLKTTTMAAVNAKRQQQHDKIAALDSQIERQDALNTQFQAKINQNNRNIAELKSVIENQERQRADLDERLLAAKNDVDQLKINVDKKREESAQLKEQVTLARMELERKRKRRLNDQNKSSDDLEPEAQERLGSTAQATSETVREPPAAGQDTGTQQKKPDAYEENVPQESLGSTTQATNDFVREPPAAGQDTGTQQNKPDAYENVPQERVVKKSLLCPRCHKTCANAGVLKRHKRIHSLGHQSFACAVCKKRFTKKSNLTKHKRIHTNERSFGCRVCGRAFTDKCNMQSHLLTHTGVKSFVCDNCPKTCSRKSNLKVHMRIHRRAEKKRTV